MTQTLRDPLLGSGAGAPFESAALGLQYVLGEWRRALEIERGEEYPKPPEDLTSAALGVLSLERKLGRWLLHASDAAPPALPAAGPSSPSEDLLR